VQFKRGLVLSERLRTGPQGPLVYWLVATGTLHTNWSKWSSGLTDSARIATTLPAVTPLHPYHCITSPVIAGNFWRLG